MIDQKYAPKIEGLRFRRFKDDSDFGLMSRIGEKSWEADGVEWMRTKDEIESEFRFEPDRDPKRDLVFVELKKETIGYGQISTSMKDPQTRICFQQAHLLPEWRGRGIREAILRSNEEEHLARARKNPARCNFFETWVKDDPNDWRTIVLANGYLPSWHVLEMVRPELNDVIDYPLPAGLEVKPVPPDMYHAVWDAMKVAYSDQPSCSEEKYNEDSYKQWLSSPEFCPDMWVVAWDNDKIVGTVQNYIDDEENMAFKHKRGHTERIFVDSSWQNKGVAKALISKSLKLLWSKGMEEAILDVDIAEAQKSVALQLYGKMGYKVINQFTFCRKPFSV